MSYSDLIRGQMLDTSLEPDEAEPQETCCMCGRPLYEGDFAFRIESDVMCQKCVENLYGFFID